MDSLKVQVRHLSDAVRNITNTYLELKDHYEGLVEVKKDMEIKIETLEDKISDIQADLDAMRHSRDSLMSWVKVITESEYTWEVIRDSGQRAMKESLEEEERAKVHKGG